MNHRLAVLMVASATAATAAIGAEGVAITDLDGKLSVKIDGELFTEYHYKDVARPYFYPIIGPGGVGMTRDWPMPSAKESPSLSSVWPLVNHDHMAAP